MALAGRTGLVSTFGGPYGMDRIRGSLYFRQLLQVLELRASAGTHAWLAPLLLAVCQATGAAAAYLGETDRRGWTCRAQAGGELREPQSRRLGGLARRMAATGQSVLEPVLRRGGLFRAPVDGVEGVRPAGFGAVALPSAGPGRAWLVAVRGPESPPFDAGTLELLRLAAETAAIARDNERLWQRQEELAMTDGLTLIPNYRYLRQAVDAQVASALRRDEHFTVVMVDVDNLKVYNAAHGHLAGSEVLRRLAAILRESVRRSDLVGKYGGDEFLLILPRTQPDGGVLLSERVRRRVAETLRGRAGEALSCSFGVAGFPEHGCDFESLIRAADQALFRAKGEGRNAVVSEAGGREPGDRSRRREAA